eukprot:2521112-Pyramimonas_sp.AAC.1
MPPKKGGEAVAEAPPPEPEPEPEPEPAPEPVAAPAADDKKKEPPTVNMDSVGFDSPHAQALRIPHHTYVRAFLKNCKLDFFWVLCCASNSSDDAPLQRGSP